MNRTGKKYVFLRPQDMNTVLRRHDMETIVVGDPNDVPGPKYWKSFVYIINSAVRFEFVAWDEKYKGVVHFVTYKDDREIIPSTTGLEAYTTLCKYYKVPELISHEDPELIKEFPSASQLIGYNEAYNGVRQEAWGYDMNNAFGYQFMNNWIDTTKPPRFGTVKEGKELGFIDNVDDDGVATLKLVRSGFAPYIFEKQEVPRQIKRFVTNWYYKRLRATNKAEKAKAKCMQTYAIGFLARRNPWIRNLVVCCQNELMESILDENSLIWNTDGFASRVRRPDIEAKLGKDIGEWKIEHTGVLAYKNNTYQWNKAVPTWRGIPKTWFPKGFDILVDPLPPNNNVWEYNPNKNRLIHQKGVML